MLITFTSTVPVGYDGTTLCNVKFDLYSKNHQTTCYGNNTKPDYVVFGNGGTQSCVIVIESNTQNTNVSLVV